MCSEWNTCSLLWCNMLMCATWDTCIMPLFKQLHCTYNASHYNKYCMDTRVHVHSLPIPHNVYVPWANQHDHLMSFSEIQAQWTIEYVKRISTSVCRVYILTMNYFCHRWIPIVNDQLFILWYKDKSCAFLPMVQYSVV